MIWQGTCKYVERGKEVIMNWLNNIVSDFQKRFFMGEESSMKDDGILDHLRKRRAAQRTRQFLVRLNDLDRRLAELR